MARTGQPTRTMPTMSKSRGHSLPSMISRGRQVGGEEEFQRTPLGLLDDRPGHKQRRERQDDRGLDEQEGEREVLPELGQLASEPGRD